MSIVDRLAAEMALREPEEALESLLGDPDNTDTDAQQRYYLRGLLARHLCKTAGIALPDYLSDDEPSWALLEEALRVAQEAGGGHVGTHS